MVATMVYPRIQIMPDQETLEAYLAGQYGEGAHVIFCLERGEFEWVVERDRAEPTHPCEE